MEERNREITVVVAPPSAKTNAGDEALVAEAVRLVHELGPDVKAKVLEHDLPLDCVLGNRAYESTPAIVPHPRRGGRGDGAHDRAVTVMHMAAHAAADFLRYESAVHFARYGVSRRLLLNDVQRRTYHDIAKASVLLVKGGGFLHAFGSWSDPYYMWYQTWYIRLAQSLGVPVVVLPNSYGPFEGPVSRSMIRRILSDCDIVTARETMSAEVLGQVLGEKVEVYPDMAFFLPSSDRNEGMELIRASGLWDVDKLKVGITVRPYRFAGSSDPEALYTKYIDSVVSLVEHIVEIGFIPVLITHVAGPSAHEDDRIAIRHVLEAVSSKKDVHWIDSDYSFIQLKSIYSNMDVVVGTRFHSCIFALSEHVPSLAIAYGGNKGVGIMEDIGMADYVLPIEEVEGPLLISMFDKLVRNHDEVRGKLSILMPKVQRQRNNLVDRCRSLISEARE